MSWHIAKFLIHWDLPSIEDLAHSAAHLLLCKQQPTRFQRQWCHRPLYQTAGRFWVAFWCLGWPRGLFTAAWILYYSYGNLVFIFSLSLSLCLLEGFVCFGYDSLTPSRFVVQNSIGSLAQKLSTVQLGGLQPIIAPVTAQCEAQTEVYIFGGIKSLTFEIIFVSFDSFFHSGRQWDFLWKDADTASWKHPNGLYDCITECTIMVMNTAA